MTRYLLLALLLIAACGNPPTETPQVYEVYYAAVFSARTAFTFGCLWEGQWDVTQAEGRTYSTSTLQVESGTLCAAYCTVASAGANPITLTIYVDGEPRWEATGNDTVYVEGVL